MDLIGWVIFIVALLISVMLHETGHFVLAKRFGMKVTQVLRRLRPDDLVDLARRDRVRDQGAALRRLRQDRRDALAGRSRRPGRRGPGVPPHAGVAADPRPVRRLGHALPAGPASWSFGLALGVGIAYDNAPSSARSAPACRPAWRLRQRHLHGVRPGLSGQAGRAAGRRRGDRHRRPAGQQLDPASNRSAPPGRDAGHRHRPARREAGDPAHQAGQHQRPLGSYLGIASGRRVPGGQPAGGRRLRGHGASARC